MTPRQERFVLEYLKDCNGTQAAIRAGYATRSAAQQAYDLLRNRPIAAAIQAATARRSRQLAIRREDLVRHLLPLANSNMFDYFRVNGDGDPVIDLTAVTRNQSGAIAKMTVEHYVDSENKRVVKCIRLKMSDRRKATMDLARLLGYLVHRTRAKVDVVSTTCTELEAKVNALPLETQKKLQAMIKKNAAAVAAILGET
jgi:phage terminase small subunit